MNNVLLAGAVPFRIVDSRREFLLVTSRRGKWIFPKGLVAPGETPEETARKEVEEEAGIEGSVVPGPIGSYEDRRWPHASTVQMFLLKYSRDSDSWKDSGRRAKRWCSYEDAVRLIQKSAVREILRRASKRLDTLGDAARVPGVGSALGPSGSTSGGE